MSSDRLTPEVTRHGEQQLTFASDIPALGSQWRATRYSQIVTVTSVRQRRICWVYVRREHTELPFRLDEFHRIFKPYRPINQEDPR